MVTNSFTKGFWDGLPIALGYLSVSFTFGMAAVAQGIPVWGAVMISMTNVTSAGQFAGLSLMAASGGMFEMALTQLIINLRYALMSLSLSQKLEKHVNLLDRFVISFCNTDEVFAVASGQRGEVGKRYLYGLILTPYFGWAIGTLIGAAASTFLPEFIRSALGIAIYGMFLAIIIPPAKHFRPVLWIVLLSAGLSCAFRWLPVLNQVSPGFVIIICTILTAAIGAKFFPINEEDPQ
ncbi:MULTISPECIES: AzlC family ABC transporter permease [Clostridiaceae]|uniref:AzlC family ABC transporter permease n=1 Tax=Clostridium facile TaxID=2763035 RepID=A0ABR7IQ86_9CLOT|nr:MULTISPECIES: AzlC family ABC transporter permease [Clostridiaceae]MBC5787300.1 AzlC family ABC transporter permease [Clostridium facile]